MGCLLCYGEVKSVASQTSRRTDPDACMLSRDITFETLIVLAPQQNVCKEESCFVSQWAEKVLGVIDRGVHLLQRGISIAHGAYTIGRTLAPLAAAMM